MSVGGRLSFSDFRSYNTLARPQRYLEISFPSFPNPFEGGNVTEVTEETESDYVLDDDYQSYGFIGSRVKPRLKKTPIAMTQSLGSIS